MLLPVNRLSSTAPLAATKFWQEADVAYMHQALQLAQQGAAQDEVPVGAVLVCDGQIIGKGFNQPIATCDPTAHAEIIALRSACTTLHNYRLPVNTTLYVTLEPCTMCVGALIHARLSRLVYAASEPRSGMVSSQIALLELGIYNHNISADSGLLQQDSRLLLQGFFKARRMHKNASSNSKKDD